MGDGQEVAEREMRKPPAGTLQFSPGLGKWAPASRVRGQGGGWGGRDREWEGSSTVPAAEREANTRATPHTYSLRRAAPNRLRVGTTGFCRAHSGGERCTPLGLCKTSTRTRNTPCPGTRRRRTPGHSQLLAPPAPDRSLIRRTAY